MLHIDGQQYLSIYRKQLEKRGSLKVNIIHCMTIGPPTVGKTTLKEQLLANHEDDTTTVEREHDRPPSSPVCHPVKRIQVIVDDKKIKQSCLAFGIDKYTWKDLTFDEEVIGFLKALSKSTSGYFTEAECIFWASYIVIIVTSLVMFGFAMSAYKYESKKSLIELLFLSIVGTSSFVTLTVIVLALYWFYFGGKICSN